ncbi:MAG: uracil-DNA glycosylase [Pseudomonadota bacterium]
MRSQAPIPLAASDPPLDCPRCPRLVAYRDANAKAVPNAFNAPVPSWGPLDARLLVVGLAPGVKGANTTGRPFTGDHAGWLLYEMLTKHGFATGTFEARSDDGLTLHDARITNAVRCVPPQNKPTTPEIKTCQSFLAQTIEEMPRLEAILCLGRISHDAVVRTLQRPLASLPFQHGAAWELDDRHAGLTLYDSYHCSRYNTNTGVLTTEMFDAVFGTIRTALQ